MNTATENLGIGMYETQNCLVVPIQEELSRSAALTIQKKILERANEKNISGVVIDLSAVQIVDSVLWEIFVKTVRMVNMLGATCIISGLNPGVVASVIDLGLDTEGFPTTLNLDLALDMLTRTEEEQTGDEEDDEAEDDGIEDSNIDAGDVNLGDAS